MELLLEQNPMRWYGTPRRRKKSRGRRSTMRRNPSAMAIPLVGQFMPRGIKLMDMVAAAGGLAAVSILPGMIVKDQATGGQKLLKLGVAFGSAIVAGFAANTISKGSANSAVLGGLAGVGLQVLNLIRPGTAIAGGRRVPVGRRIGASDIISEPFTREGERIGVLQP